MVKTFSAQVENHEKLTMQNMLYVASEAIQDVVAAAMTPQRGVTKGGTFEEGKIPVAEAELFNSLTSDGIVGPESYVVAIANMKIGDTMQFAWTAPHAMRMEVGFMDTDSLGRKFNQRGRHFVGQNARRFAEFVEKYAGEF